MDRIHTILMPHDFSEHAGVALGIAAELARKLEADLHLLHVVQPPAYLYASDHYVGGPFEALGLRQEAERQLARLKAGLPKARGGVEAHVIEAPRVAETIDEYAEKIGADLIVMGTHGRAGLSHALFGSIAERTLRYSPCPVLTVPMPKPAAA